MRTLTFYIIKNNELVKLNRYENVKGYSVNYHDYPTGTFYTDYDLSASRILEIYGMFNKIKQLGNFNVLTQKSGEDYILKIEGENIRLVNIDKDTVEFMESKVQSKCDNLSLDKIEQVGLRNGSSGVVDYITEEIMGNKRLKK